MKVCSKTGFPDFPKTESLMKKQPLRTGAVACLLFLAMTACATPQASTPPPPPQESAGDRAETLDSPRVLQPGAPGEPSQSVEVSQLANQAHRPHTPADVEFMQGMIPHHAQALDMAALVEERTQNRDIHLLAKRIEISQRDEIELMGRWLAHRGEDVPGEHAHHMMGDHLMPGMLTEADMAELAAGHDSEFDRLFLEHMIRHHEGAIVMVKALFASPGAGQETDMFTFASHVEADQLIEIRRMKEMLDNRR